MEISEEDALARLGIYTDEMLAAINDDRERNRLQRTMSAAIWAAPGWVQMLAQCRMHSGREAAKKVPTACVWVGSDMTVHIAVNPFLWRAIERVEVKTGILPRLAPTKGDKEDQRLWAKENLLYGNEKAKLLNNGFRVFEHKSSPSKIPLGTINPPGTKIDADTKESLLEHGILLSEFPGTWSAVLIDLRVQIAILIHELLHVLFLHMEKKNFENFPRPDVRNWAMDTSINQYIGSLPPYVINLAYWKGRGLELEPTQSFSHYYEKIIEFLKAQEDEEPPPRPATGFVAGTLVAIPGGFTTIESVRKMQKIVSFKPSDGSLVERTVIGVQATPIVSAGKDAALAIEVTAGQNTVRTTDETPLFGPSGPGVPLPSATWLKNNPFSPPLDECFIWDNNQGATAQKIGATTAPLVEGELQYHLQVLPPSLAKAEGWREATYRKEPEHGQKDTGEGAGKVLDKALKSITEPQDSDGPRLDEIPNFFADGFLVAGMGQGGPGPGPGPGPGEPEPGGGEGGGKPKKPLQPRSPQPPPPAIDDHSPWEDNEVPDKVRESVIQDMLRKAKDHAEKENQWGDLPGGVRVLIEGILHPKVSWRGIIPQWIGEHIKQDWKRTRQRPSRRYSDPYPGRVPKRSDPVWLAIDTSGSISEQELGAFLAEAEPIKRLTGEVYIVPWDVGINDVVPFQSKEQLMRYIKTGIPGGGGTDVSEVFFAARNPHKFTRTNQPDLVRKVQMYLSTRPRAIVVMTDGFIARWPTPEEAAGIPVLWAITKESQVKSPKVGKSFHLDVRS